MILLLVGALFWFAVEASPVASSDNRPNVLLIVVDDLNDWVGCLGGHPNSKTPNIDRLAKRGLLFENAYCAAPTCNPSRTSMLTGLRPSSSGVYLNSQPWQVSMPDVLTLPHHFRKSGYYVAGGGKIFHNWYPDEKAWDYYFPKHKHPEPEKRPVNGIANAGSFDWGALDVDEAQMGDHKMIDYAIGELQKEHDKPLFLACGIFRPHLPWYVPEKYFEAFKENEIALPKINDEDLDDVPTAGTVMALRNGDHEKVTQSKNYRKAVQGYLASISFADAQVGRLIDALDKSEYANNTIVILLGDHGWHLGEKLHWRKFTLWEEATRVPLLISAPDVTQPNRRCQRTVSLMDIYPTISELCNLSIPDHLEGVSLVPLLKNPKRPWERVAVSTSGRNNHSIRSERWRYIRYADGSEELYDHASDSLEWKNLASDPKYKDVIDNLSQHLPMKNAPNVRR